jgi:L-asparaginase II
MVTNPVLVEAVRGQIVESRHRGAAAVVDAAGRLRFGVGDIDLPVFPRSSVKAIQALPLVESGASDAFGFGDREIALACASHSGEPTHVERAAAMLAAAGLDETALECGAHWPNSQKADHALAAAGREPGPLHNNCSGKHAGFLCTCVHLARDHRGYVGAGHSAQEDVRAALEAVTGHPHDASSRAVDGCAIPTYATPLRALAHGFARMATGEGLPPLRARAAGRILQACMAEPFMISGTDGLDTAVMRALPRRVFVKVGAEGVYCAALPGQGLGIALKCDDGATRGAETALVALVGALLASGPGGADVLAAAHDPLLRNRNGDVVGALRATTALAVN